MTAAAASRTIGCARRGPRVPRWRDGTMIFGPSRKPPTRAAQPQSKPCILTPCQTNPTQACASKALNCSHLLDPHMCECPGSRRSVATASIAPEMGERSLERAESPFQFPKKPFARSVQRVFAPAYRRRCAITRACDIRERPMNGQRQKCNQRSPTCEGLPK